MTKEKESPPLVLGPHRLHYQYSVALPQVHLTFVSILQGIAFGILLVNIPLPNAADVRDPFGFLVKQHAYLPYIISGMIILVIWKQFVQASMFYIWPLSMRQLTLMLLIAVAEIVAFQEIAHFSAWLIGLGFVGIIGGGIRLNNINMVEQTDYEFKHAKERDGLIERLAGFLYVALGLFVVAAGTAIHSLLRVDSQRVVVQWAVLGITVLLMCVIFLLDWLHLKQLVEDAVGYADLELTSRGVLRYKRDPVEVGTTPSGANTPPALTE